MDKAARKVEKKDFHGIRANVSKRVDAWRLVHDGKKALWVFKADGETVTQHELFIGTKADCLAEIEKLNLEFNAKVLLDEEQELI